MADAQILIRYLADAWHAYHLKCEAANARGEREPDENDPDFWATHIMQMLPGDGDPMLMWECAVEIWHTMDRENASRTGLYAASIMEDLIDDFGLALVDRIEAKAKEDPEFRKMLLGVWPPTDESRPDWQRIVKLVEDLGPMQSFKDRKGR